MASSMVTNRHVTNLFEYHITNYYYQQPGLNTFTALQFLHLNPKPEP